MVVYTIGLASIHDFAPADMRLLNVYFLLVGLLVVPKMMFALCTAIGTCICRLRHGHKNYGILVGALLVMYLWYVLIYGITIGPRELVVKHKDLYFKDLPAKFDGYKITQFSDIHVGTYLYLNKHFPERVVDSIMAQHSDMIAFTGDIQNLQPKELDAFVGLLGRLKAPDGVYSILGNHDYSEYVKASQKDKLLLEKQTQEAEKRMRWNLLMNENRIIRHGNDSIVIAGTENDGQPPFTCRANYAKTLKGISDSAFVVMLQHDPSAWTRNILTKTNVQLTLSGHTHGGQVSLFGLRPTHIRLNEDLGLYMRNGRMLNVSAGVGGLVPFRYGVTPEIVVITLHKIK